MERSPHQYEDFADSKADRSGRLLQRQGWGASRTPTTRLTEWRGGPREIPFSVLPGHCPAAAVRDRGGRTGERSGDAAGAIQSTSGRRGVKPPGPFEVGCRIGAAPASAAINTEPDATQPMAPRQAQPPSWHAGVVHKLQRIPRPWVRSGSCAPDASEEAAGSARPQPGSCATSAGVDRDDRTYYTAQKLKRTRSIRGSNFTFCAQDRGPGRWESHVRGPASRCVRRAQTDRICARSVNRRPADAGYCHQNTYARSASRLPSANRLASQLRLKTPTGPSLPAQAYQPLCISSIGPDPAQGHPAPRLPCTFTFCIDREQAARGLRSSSARYLQTG